jgi:hypothetical protein
MSCEACESYINEGIKFWYRWNNAKIVIIGCQKHVSEVIKTLNEAQENASR